MKKCQGFLNHLLYSKKKHIHQTCSLDNSTNNNNKIANIINYNSKVSKSKPKISLNKTQDIKLANNPIIETKKWLPPQSHIKLKSQNHSFTSAITSEKLFLNASNQKNQQASQNPQMTTNFPQQNSDIKPVSQVSQMQLRNNYSNITYYNKMKQKMSSSSIMQDKSSANVSFYQYHKGLLSNLKLQKEKKSGQYLNKSMSSYEEEWCDKDTHPNANSSLSLLNRLKFIEGELEDGLNELNRQSEGKIVSIAKSYNLYKNALEEVVKELPQDYCQILRKIVNGYHQIMTTFVSEQKKIIENYDGLQTKYTSISKELIAVKSSNNLDNNDQLYLVKSQSQFDKNTQQGQGKEEQHSTKVATGNTYLFSLLNNNNNNTTTTIKQPKKQESFPNEKEDKGYINYTNGDKKKNSNQLNNRKEIEDLEALYFSDKVINGTNSSIAMTKVPKLALNFLDEKSIMS